MSSLLLRKIRRRKKTRKRRLRSKWKIVID